MSHFIWPSDLDRAENEELNRVCETLEEVQGECEALAGHVERLDLKEIPAVLRHGQYWPEAGELKQCMAEAPATSLTNAKKE